MTTIQVRRRIFGGKSKSEIEMNNLYFRNKVIGTVGYHFINCRFDGCTLTGASAHLTNCSLQNTSMEIG